MDLGTINYQIGDPNTALAAVAVNLTIEPLLAAVLLAFFGWMIISAWRSV